MQSLLTALFGPVFTKEMIELARRSRYYFVRVFYGLAILFVLWITFSSYGWRLNQPGASVIHLMAEFASMMFHSVATLQFIALFEFVPMFLCGVVAGEREERTLELLFTTTLNDREIILGKMLSRLVVFWLLILMSLPIFALISFFGGISPESLFRVLGATLVALYYVGAHSIYFSTITKSPMGALLRTVLRMAFRLLILPYGFILTVVVFTGPATRGLIEYMITFVCCTNPIGPLVIALSPDVYDTFAGHATTIGGRLLGDWFFPLLMVIPISWSSYLIWRAMRQLRFSPAATRSVFLKFFPIRKLYQAVTNVVAAPFRAVRSPSGRFLWMFPVRNPLWLRARQSHCFDREGHLHRLQAWSWVVAILFVAVAALAGWVHHENVLGHEAMIFAFLPATWIALAVFSTIVAGVSVVGDRRRGFFDLLLTTPLSNHEIIKGLFLSVWVHIALLAALPIALSVLFLCTGAGSLSDLSMSLAIAYSFLCAVVLQGIACSLCARTLAGALVPACLFVFIELMGLGFLAAVFEAHAAGALWFFCITGLFVTSFWVRKRVTAASVGVYFLFVHLGMVTGATYWNGDFQYYREGLAVAASMPSAMAVTVFSHRSSSQLEQNPAVYLRHILGTFAFCLWARWWLSAHFEALVGRAGARERRPGTLAAVFSGLIHFFYWCVPEAVRPRWPRRVKRLPPVAEPVLAEAPAENA
jgi:ABC-2 type transport system permease protein